MFGRKEPKPDKKAQKYLDKIGIEGLESNVDAQVKRIASDLAGVGLMKTGLALSLAKVEEQAKVGYLSALVEQNWILIKQNDEILKELKQLNSK